MIFSQGDTATDVFYIQSGSVKVSVLSRTGKEAVVAVLGQGDFFGLPGRATATHRDRISDERQHRARDREAADAREFRDLGFIEYNGEITVKSALLTVVLHE